MTVAAEVLALRDALAPAYGAQIADLATRPGAVTCVINPTDWTYESTLCDPLPVSLTCEVAVLAAQGGQRGTIDLLGHEPAVIALIVAAGWVPTECRADTVADLPALVISCSKPTTT